MNIDLHYITFCAVYFHSLKSKQHKRKAKATKKERKENENCKAVEVRTQILSSCPPPGVVLEREGKVKPTKEREDTVTRGII